MTDVSFSLNDINLINGWMIVFFFFFSPMKIWSIKNPASIASKCAKKHEKYSFHIYIYTHWKQIFLQLNENSILQIENLLNLSEVEEKEWDNLIYSILKTGVCGIISWKGINLVQSPSVFYFPRYFLCPCISVCSHFLGSMIGCS